jgi:hypothetical protein
VDWLWITLIVLALVSGIVLALVSGVWVLFHRPTGPRIVRFARRYKADHPTGTEGDVREALRQRFLGGIRPQHGSLDAVVMTEFWLVEKFLMIFEGLRDYFYPINRTAVAARIEAAIQIVFTVGEGERGPTS